MAIIEYPPRFASPPTKGRLGGVEKVILTASGGALRDWPLSKLRTAKVKDVLTHPSWEMGAKITVDSATLVNKALEVIEASQLFGMSLSKIEAVIHPQSIVHALVEWMDGSVTAQLAEPNMRLPIQLALFEGKRIQKKGLRVIKRLDLTKQALEFRPVDPKRYPLFEIILKAAKKSPLTRAVAVLAAERAVELFLAGKINYLDQINFVKKVLQKLKPSGSVTLEKLDKLQKEI